MAHEIEINGSERRSRGQNIERLVSLNFKVPFVFRQTLKIYAAQEGLSMKDLLVLLFDQHLARSQLESARGAKRENKEVEK
jgi:hypothetical protein